MDGLIRFEGDQMLPMKLGVLAPVFTAATASLAAEKTPADVSQSGNASAGNASAAYPIPEQLDARNQVDKSPITQPLPIREVLGPLDAVLEEDEGTDRALASLTVVVMEASSLDSVEASGPAPAGEKNGNTAFQQAMAVLSLALDAESLAATDDEVEPEQHRERWMHALKRVRESAATALAIFKS